MAADIVTHLNSSIRKKLQSEDALNRGGTIGGDVMPNSPKEEHDKVAKEAAIWAVIVEKAGVKSSSHALAIKQMNCGSADESIPAPVCRPLAKPSARAALDRPT